MTISTSFPRTTPKASSTTLAFPFTMDLAFSTSLSATTAIRIARPARRWISSALRLSTSQVPPPTMPMPSSPTLMGFMFPEAQLEVALHLGPFAREHAVHDGVAYRPVAARPVVADHAIFLRPERLDRALGGEVEVVGAQADDLASGFFEGVGKKKKLASRVDVTALEALGVPGIPDLDAVGGRDDVVIPSAADDFSRRRFSNHPGEHVAVLQTLQRGADIARRLAGRRHAGKPELPEPAVARRLVEAGFVRPGKRLEAHPMPFERHRLRADHAAPLRRPSFLNMSRMPRTAWRRRCSFSISAMRTWSSP